MLLKSLAHILPSRYCNVTGAELDGLRYHQDGSDHRLHAHSSRDGGGGPKGRPRGRFVEDESGTLAGLSNILRDFIPRLPTHSGPLPDVDGFIRQLRGCILPPRPAEITASEMDYGGGGGSGGLQPVIGIKRGVGGMDGPPSSSVTAPTTNEEDDDDEEEQDDQTNGAREDVFRQRQRARLALL